MINNSFPSKRIVIISVNAASLIGFRGSLIKSLVAKGNQVFALASDFDTNTRRGVESMGAKAIDINLMRTGINPFLDLRDTYHLSQLIRRIKPDITLTYYIKSVIFGTMSAWIARVPHRVSIVEGLGSIYTEDGTPTSAKWKVLRFITSALYRFALYRSHAVVFLNPDDIRDFISWGIVESQKAIELGGIGVDLDEWIAKPVTVKPIRFLFIGRLLREKGIQQFADAARIIKTVNPEVEFIVLGNVDSNPNSIQNTQICAWVAEGLLTWPGHVPVRPWLEKSSVFVLPSYYREGLPRSTQEAMAVGLPVITTDVPGCRQTVDDGVNGFLVPVRDPEALASAMLRFINQPELIPIMGYASRRLAEERFDVNKFNAKLMLVMGLS